VCGVGRNQVGGDFPAEVTLEVKGVRFWWLLHWNRVWWWSKQEKGREGRRWRKAFGYFNECKFFCVNWNLI